MRKHRTQMGKAEIEAAEAYVHGLKAQELADHAFKRMDTKNVTLRDIFVTIKYGRIIEVNTEGSGMRVLMRLDFGKPKVAVCVVLALDNLAVVTVWKNAGNDAHKTLDISQYQWKVDFRALLAA